MPTPRGASRADARRLLCVVAFVALLAAGCAGAPAPDLVIRHAKVFTNDTARPWAEALAIKGERVVAVGDEAAIAALAGASTRVIDAGGRVVVPGFNDARVDLPVTQAPTPQALAELDRDAVAHGVTSLQVVAGGPMRVLVAAAQQAPRAARWRLIRSPEDTGAFDVATVTNRPKEDEKPFLPPQPGVRLVANGVQWALAGAPNRQATPPDRVPAVLGWAYGAEDPIVITTRGDAAFMSAFHGIGLPEVWARKRPRVDTFGEVPASAVPEFAARGVVLTVIPRARLVAPERSIEPDAGRQAPRGAWVMWSPQPFLDAHVVVAVGRGEGETTASVFARLCADVALWNGRTWPAPLSREDAVRAMTWGSAYAEKAERDKGWLGPGTLADIAVLSDDVFTAPGERLPAVTSVLTLVGGTIVYDPGVLTSR